MAKLKLTSPENAALLQAVKEQAVATAKYWDTLRQLELTYDIEIDSDPREMNDLAFACKIPPCVGDLKMLRLSDVLGLLTVKTVETPGAKGRHRS